MTAVPQLSDPLSQLRNDLARRFPGVLVLQDPDASSPSSFSSREASPHSLVPTTEAKLHRAPFAWVEVAAGDGGLAWLAAWSSLAIARDPLGRPALWIDTHATFTPGDLLDLEGKLVIVRPTDPHEAHVAADIALRAGSFCIVALEMHRALHPKPLARLARLASSGAQPLSSRTQLVLWGEPPSFVAPPSGVPRTPFNEAIHALYEGLAQGIRHEQPLEQTIASTAGRTPHSTDRLRPLDRAADRRASASGPRPLERFPGRGRVDDDGVRASVSPLRYPTRP